jgi:hypothetical protein
MFLFIIYFWFIDNNIIYCLDEETSKKLVEAVKNSNPTINL